MVHVTFDVGQVSIQDLIGQSGGGISYFEGLPYQRGVAQRGAGVGDVLRRFWRFIVPLASRAGHALAPIAREVGKEAAMAGSRALADVAEGTDIKEALASQGRAGVKRLLKRAVGDQSGGRKAKKRRLIGSSVILKPHALDGRLCSVSVPKRKDALGPY